jgi:predicted dehydrogenase
MKTLRVAVIGAGYLGRYHAEKYARMPGVELAAVVDCDFSRARALAERLGSRPFAHHREMLERVDAVSVVVPTSAHFAVAGECLAGGKDVLIEKPMTVTLEEADALIDLAEAHGRILQVGHLERFNPAVLALREIVGRPRFIESHRLGFFKERATDVSVVLDLMIHDIDLIASLVQSEVRQIHAAGIAVVTRQLDIANARLEFENGCVANVTASRISAKEERKLRIFQRDAYISVDFLQRAIHQTRIDGAPPAESPAGPVPGLSLRRIGFEEGDALWNELTAFVAAVRERRVPEVNGRTGRRALTIALNIMEQIRLSAERLADT